MPGTGGGQNNQKEGQIKGSTQNHAQRAGPRYQGRNKKKRQRERGVERNRNNKSKAAPSLKASGAEPATN